MGRVASYNGCAAYPGYILQQKLKHTAAFLLTCSAYYTALPLLFCLRAMKESL